MTLTANYSKLVRKVGPAVGACLSEGGDLSILTATGIFVCTISPSTDTMFSFLIGTRIWPWSVSTKINFGLGITVD